MPLQTKLHPDKDGYITCYKFRGIRIDCEECMEVDLSRIEDILNGNLYCSDWRSQNDVLEGKYYYRVSDLSTKELVFGSGKRFQEQKSAYRICSLTTALTIPLMWAFYASNNAGVAIEIKLPYPSDDVVPMTYGKGIPFLDLTSVGKVDMSDGDGSWTRTIVWHILTHKTTTWQHEREVRIVVDGSQFQEYKYPIQKPVRLYYGPRMDATICSKLQRICNSHKLEMIPIAMVDEAQFGKHFDFKKGAFVDA